MTLAVRQLGFARDDCFLFDGLSFDLPAGEVLQVEGPNGSGKTTLLRILCGLTRPTCGSLSWRERPVEQQRPEFAASLAYLGHRSGLKEALSPRENLHASAALAGRPREGIDAALARVGLAALDEELPCRALSAGQQRRVALARLLLSGAPLWVLDEPFTALDRDGRLLVEQLIAEHSAGGGMTVVSTHHGIHLPAVSVRELRLG